MSAKPHVEEAGSRSVYSAATAVVAQPMRFELFLGEKIGSEYASHNFAFVVEKADLTDDTLTLHYPSYAGGTLSGTLLKDGSYRGTFETTRSTGSFAMTFQEDGSATGTWVLDEPSRQRFGLSVDAASGPNVLRRRQ